MVAVRLDDYAVQLQAISRSPLSDVKHLLAHCLQIPAANIHAVVHLSPSDLDRFMALFAQRVKGVPVAYLLSEWEFWGLTLKLNRNTLIPRPETECLVEAVLSVCPKTSPLRVLDCGTGSGAIALALASERPHWHVVGIDDHKDCVICAQENLDRHRDRCKNAHFLQANWSAYLPLQQSFDVIVSNPPYIEKDDPTLDAQVAMYEPSHALYAQDGGYNDLRVLIELASMYLHDGGMLFLEHGSKQSRRVKSMMREHGFIHVESKNDLAGHARVTSGVMASRD